MAKKKSSGARGKLSKPKKVGKTRSTGKKPKASKKKAKKDSVASGAKSKSKVARSPKAATGDKIRVIRTGVRADRWNPVFGWQVLRRSSTYIAESKVAFAAARAAAESGNARLAEVVNAIHRDYQIQTAEEYRESGLKLHELCKMRSNDLAQHQMMLVQIEKLTTAFLAHTDADPVKYNGNDPWENWVDVHPWDDSVPELRQWLERWGHVMAFPIPADINLVSPFILSRFWRLKTVEIIREREESDGSEIRSGFDGEPLTVFFSNRFLTPDGKRIEKTIPRPLFARSKESVRSHRAGWPASACLRLALRINPNFEDSRIIADVIKQLSLILPQIREDLSISPKFTENDSMRDENNFEYFFIWDLQRKIKAENPTFGEYSAANDLWPEVFNQSTDDPNDAVRKILERNKSKKIKKAGDDVRYALNKVNDWISELEPQEIQDL